MNRTDVVTAARTWIDTPFHHQARLKGVGVDCVGLVIGVARELGLIPMTLDVKGYPRVPDGTSLMSIVHEHMMEIPNTDMQPGDVIVVSFAKDPQHLAILGDYRHGGLSIIHAAGNSGRVLETRLMFSTAMKFVAAFKLPGID